MSGGGAARVPLAGLVKGAKLGKGGQGTVWEVRKRLINGEWPVVYKEYESDKRRELKTGVLEQMVAFLPRQTSATGRWLGEHTAWPAALVSQGNEVHGFLMRRIPDEYFLVLKASSEKKPAGFEFLLNGDGYLRMAGISLTPRERFQLLLDLAEKLERLHSLGVVVGDLSPKNLLFSLQGSPSCFLIDCDAMVLAGQWALKPVQTPGWSLPGAEEPTTPAGDVHKFGLLAARLFLGDQQRSDVGVLRSADAAVGRLAQRSLDHSPAKRPAIGEWLGPLRSAVGTAPATLPRQAPKPTPTVVSSPTPTPSPAQRVRTVRITTPATAPARTPAAARTSTPARTPASARTRTSVSSSPVARPRPSAQPRKWSGGWILFLLLLLVGAVVLGAKMHRGVPWDKLFDDYGSSSETPDAREGQAEKLQSMLRENDGNRGSVSKSVESLMSCPGSSQLREDQSVFDAAAENRDRLVGALDGVSLGRLPDGLTEDLLAGWKSSAEADRAYSRLAVAMADGCSTDRVTSSDDWADAERANVQATRAKKSFVDVWNPLAEEYGLRTLSWDEV